MDRIGLALLIGMLLWQVPALAEGTGDKPRARELNIAAVEAYKSGKFDEAIKLFQGAIALDASLCTAYSGLGSTFAKAGKLTEAYQAYKKFLERCPTHKQVRVVLGITREWEQMRPDLVQTKFESEVFGPPSQEEIGALLPASETPSQPAGKGNSAMLDVSIVGSWAYVFIDGEKIKTTPLIGHEIDPGEHVIELKGSNDEVLRRWSVRIRPGQKLKFIHQNQQ